MTFFEKVRNVFAAFGTVSVMLSACVPAPAAAQEVGEQYYWSIACPTAELSREYMDGWRHSALVGNTIGNKLVMTGQCSPNPRGIAWEIAEIVEVASDFEEDLMIMFHPKNQLTGETGTEVFGVTWNINRVDLIDALEAENEGT